MLPVVGCRRSGCSWAWQGGETRSRGNEHIGLGCQSLLYLLNACGKLGNMPCLLLIHLEYELFGDQGHQQQNVHICLSDHCANLY